MPRRDTGTRRRAVGAEAVKAAQDPPAPLRRKVALDVGDQKDQHAQQHHDFDGIIEKELNAAADPARRVKAAGFDGPADQPAQPFHPQNFRLEKVTDPPDFIHKTASFISIFFDLDVL